MGIIKKGNVLKAINGVQILEPKEIVKILKSTQKERVELEILEKSNPKDCKRLKILEIKENVVLNICSEDNLEGNSLGNHKNENISNQEKEENRPRNIKIDEIVINISNKIPSKQLNTYDNCLLEIKEKIRTLNSEVNIPFEIKKDIRTLKNEMSIPLEIKDDKRLKILNTTDNLLLEISAKPKIVDKFNETTLEIKDREKVKILKVENERILEIKDESEINILSHANNSPLLEETTKKAIRALNTTESAIDIVIKDDIKEQIASVKECIIMKSVLLEIKNEHIVKQEKKFLNLKEYSTVELKCKDKILTVNKLEVEITQKLKELINCKAEIIEIMKFKGRETKKDRLKKEIDLLKRRIEEIQQESVELKNEIKKQSSKIRKVSDQIYNTISINIIPKIKKRLLSLQEMNQVSLNYKIRELVFHYSKDTVIKKSHNFISQFISGYSLNAETHNEKIITTQERKKCDQFFNDRIINIASQFNRNNYTYDVNTSLYNLYPINTDKSILTEDTITQSNTIELFNSRVIENSKSEINLESSTTYLPKIDVNGKPDNQLRIVIDNDKMKILKNKYLKMKQTEQIMEAKQKKSEHEIVAVKKNFNLLLKEFFGLKEHSKQLQEQNKRLSGILENEKMIREGSVSKISTEKDSVILSLKTQLANSFKAIEELQLRNAVLAANNEFVDNYNFLFDDKLEDEYNERLNQTEQFDTKLYSRPVSNQMKIGNNSRTVVRPNTAIHNQTKTLNQIKKPTGSSDQFYSSPYIKRQNL